MLSAQELIEQGRAVAQAGKLDEAEDLIEQALAKEPNHPRALAIKGTIFNAKKKFQEAIPWLQKAIKADPDLGMAYMNLGTAQGAIGELNESEKSLRKAVELNPEKYEAHFCLGYTLCINKKIHEGIGELIESIKVNPAFPQAYLLLGDLYSKAGKADVAKRVYIEALRHNPEDSAIRQKLSELHVAENFEPHNGVGIRLLKQDRVDEAIEEFKKACRLAPVSSIPAFNLALAFAKAGKKDQARDVLNKIVANQRNESIVSNAKRLLTVLSLPNESAQD